MALYESLKQYQIDAIKKMKLSLEQVWIIEQMVMGAEVEQTREYGQLELRSFIKEGSLTALARDVYHGIINMEKPLENKKVKKPKVQLLGIEKYGEAWKVFWDTWPYTKSVPGTVYKSGAVMKKDEAKMYQKWVAAIEGGKISVAGMQYSAECYLQWAYEESKLKGRNELQYRNGMEPWLTQAIYLSYVNKEMPKKVTVDENNEANCA